MQVLRPRGRVVWIADWKRRTLVVCIVLAMTIWCDGAVAQVSADEAASRVPWWKQEKIRLFWGQWRHHEKAGVSIAEVIENLSRVGATVFVTDDMRADEEGPSGFNVENARVAQDNGVRYFAAIYGSYMRERSAQMNAPLALDAKGGHQFGYGRYTTIPLPCPVYEPLYNEHILDPLLVAARSGLIDGVLLDWEPYERPEAGLCYCERCFHTFAQARGKVPEAKGVQASARQAWLERHRLADDYPAHHERRRLAMFHYIRERVHEVKSDFVFAGYHVNDWTVRAGLHSQKTPFFVVDQRHYFQDHTRPWWNSFYAREKELGYIHVAGTYNITFFGIQPETDVPLDQWMYDAAINTDGCWVWFAEQLGPEMWRSFWTANHRIRTTETKLRPFLFHGRRADRFALPIEWSGDPWLADKLLHRVYQYGDESLIHVHNVDTDRPVQVRLRLRLPADSRWIVRDPIGGLIYTHGRAEVIWTGARLNDGILVALKKRSELFVQLTPAKVGQSIDRRSTINGDLSAPMPDHADAPVGAAVAGDGTAAGALVYTRSQDMGYHSGRDSGWSQANAIYRVNSDGEGNRQVRQLKGYLWSPVWSPDGTRIAFCHDANGRGQIFVMNADGAGAINVSNNVHCDRGPVWSPDSSKLAFVSDRSGAWDICVMTVDGTSQVQLTADAANNRAPTWSPDGDAIAFESDRGGDVDIYVMNADGSDQRSITPEPGDQKEPAWSPNGLEIAHVGLGWMYPALTVVNVETGQSRIVVVVVTYVGNHQWSPDGKQIAGVYRTHTWGQPAISGIFLVDPNETTNMERENDTDGKGILVKGDASVPHHAGRRDPTFIPTWYAHGGASPRWVVKVFSGLSWSPDGRQLAFSSNIADDGYFHVYTTMAQGGAARMIADTSSAWPQSVNWRQRN